MTRESPSSAGRGGGRTAMLVVGLVLILVGAYALVSRLAESVDTSSDTYAGITRVDWT